MNTEKSVKKSNPNNVIGNRFPVLHKRIIILMIVTVSIAAIALIRGKLIVVRNYSVPCEVSKKIRVVGLADLHGGILGKNQNRIVSKVQEVQPDIIVCLGDMVDRSKAEESMEALTVLVEQLVKVAPVYYVDGNHEQEIFANEPDVYNELNKSLEDLGAVQLDNETVQLIIDADTGDLLAKSTEDSIIVNLCGISTHYYWEDKEYAVATDLRAREGINVMICHYPETVIWRGAFEGGGLDLALCGHTHGGLIRVPLLGGMYAPEWGWWPLFDLGEYSIYSDTTWKNYGGDTGAEYWGTMIVSGGLAGEHGVPRVNNPMEISVVDIG